VKSILYTVGLAWLYISSLLVEGDFSFWLGVCDGKIGAYKDRKPHVALYDVYETKVNIVGGTPFKITTISKSSRYFKRGKEVTINWQVDKNIFGESLIFS